MGIPGVNSVRFNPQFRGSKPPIYAQHKKQLAVKNLRLEKSGQKPDLIIPIMADCCRESALRLLRREVEANVRERNVKATPVNWRFTTQNARRKLARLYPCIST